MAEVKYLGYILMSDGIKSQPKKVSAILALELPKNVRELRAFLGMAQYYCDMWEKCSHLLAPLSNLVRDSRAKETRKSGAKNPFHWDKIHQTNFDVTKEVIACKT